MLDNTYEKQLIKDINTLSQFPDLERQPKPIHTKYSEVVYTQVLNDIQERATRSKEEYKTYLESHNGRNALIDAYQEALDLCMYLKQTLIELRQGELTHEKPFHPE